MPNLENSASAILNLEFNAPETSASTSEADLYSFGFTLKTDFFATKNLPSSGSIPAKIAGAPSHLTVMFTDERDAPANISLRERTKLIEPRAPSIPKFKISSSICSRCRFLPPLSSARKPEKFNIYTVSIHTNNFITIYNNIIIQKCQRAYCLSETLVMVYHQKVCF